MSRASARILVPPGIGDGYWILVKLRGFLARLKLQTAEVFVHDAGGPRRSGKMWERVPFVSFRGYAEIPKGPSTRRAFNRAYKTPGTAVQSRVLGFDYFLSANGSLDHGMTLDQALPGPTNWYEPLCCNGITQKHAATFGARFGPYVVAAFWDHGFYRKWLEAFGGQQIVETLARIADAGKTVVVTGAAWDRGAICERIAAADPRFVSTVGETSFDELAGLLAGAESVVGFPAGSTILGPYFRTPTVMLWHRHFPRSFWRSACAPDPANYRPIDVESATPATVAARARGLARRAA
jgi:hypothetical protein